MGRFKSSVLSLILAVGLILGVSLSAKASLVDFFENFANNLISGVVTSVYEYASGALKTITNLATGTVTHFANGNISSVDALYVAWDMDGLRQYIKDNGYEEALKDFWNVDSINKLNAAQILKFLSAPESQGGGELNKDDIEDIFDDYTSTEIVTTTYEYDSDGKLVATHTPVVDENGNVVDGKQNTTHYDNGKIDKITGWVYDKENESWNEAELDYICNDNGRIIKAEGNLALAQGLSQQMLLEGEDLDAEGTIFFDDIGRMKEFGFGAGDGYAKRAEFHYDAQGRLTLVDIYNNDSNKVKALTYHYAGNNITKVVLTENKGGGYWAVVSTTHYVYGRNNELLYTYVQRDVSSSSDYEEFKNAMKGSPYWDEVFGSMSEEKIEETLHQLYEALCKGTLRIGGSIEINGITFKLVKEGEGSRIDANSYHFRHLPKELTKQLGKGIPTNTVTDYTYYVFGRPIYTTTVGLSQTEGYDWDTMWGDPAVTGQVYQDDEGNWHMKVIVWTNEEKTEWEEVSIILDLSLLSEEERAEIENILNEYAQSGENLTLYGATSTGEISEGTTLQILGLGKGPFEEHPFDF